jgi:hypothetical protein
VAKNRSQTAALGIEELPSGTSLERAQPGTLWSRVTRRASSIRLEVDAEESDSSGSCGVNACRCGSSAQYEFGKCLQGGQQAMPELSL